MPLYFFQKFSHVPIWIPVKQTGFVRCSLINCFFRLFHWKSFLLLPVLSVVLGVIMILNPFGTMETLVMAIGLILILEGALNLLSALYTMLAVRRFIKLHPETQSMLEAITGQDLNGDGVIAPDVSHADVESTAVELDYVDESAEVEQENK